MAVATWLLLYVFEREFREAPRQGPLHSRRKPWAEVDYIYRILDRLTSTPHQPANACLAPSLPPDAAENDLLQAWKIPKIKGLAGKRLKRRDYRNRRDLGS